MLLRSKATSFFRSLSIGAALLLLFSNPASLCYGQLAPQDGALNPAVSGADLPETGNVTVNFKNVDIRTVLNYLSEVSGIDIVPSPEVSGDVTMRLRNKPWEVALDVVTRNRGYVYSRDDDAGIIRVLPKSKLQDEEPVSEVIFLNYISPGQVSLGERENSKYSTISDNTEIKGEAKGLIEVIEKILVGNESVTYIADTNSLVVTAVPARIQVIKRLVERLDKKTPQVMLEAKVIEVTLDRDDQFGIDWNMVISAAGARRPTTLPFTNQGVFPFLPGGQRDYYPSKVSYDNNANFPLIDAASLVDPTAAATAGAVFAYGTLDFSQFTAILRMIDNRDDVTILSSPRVTTLNNQRATIKVVNNIYLQTRQESTESARTITVEFEDEPRETGVILNVIPHVNDRNEITVDLRPEVSTIPQFQELEVSNAQNTVAMSFNSREAETQVMVPDGGTIFIGGLINERVDKQEHKVPVLGDLFGWIPVVGNALRYEQDNVAKTEIVFFITVHLLDGARDSLNKFDIKRTYDKYYPAGNGGSDGSAGQPVLQKGLLKSEKKTVEVPLSSGPAEKEEERKPFLDFRDKKEQN
jgi:type IV pilus secretin PilQ/predicted competence protein